MKGAKKDKKNGKDSGGGVVAAVTKHAAGKFTLVCPSCTPRARLRNAPHRKSASGLLPANVLQVVTVPPTRSLLLTPRHPRSSPQT